MVFDRYLVMGSYNWVWFVCFNYFNRDNKMRILIIIESGIGNVIFLTPMIKTLHKVYINPEITILSSRYRREGEILEGWKYIKQSIYSATELKHQDFDRVFISPMYGSNFNHFIINVPREKIFNLNCDRTIDWNVEHEVEVNMRILRQEGYSGGTPNTEVNMKPTRISLNKNRLKIGFHAGCLNHPDYAKKLWINERWDELAEKLEKKFNAQIIWFGSGNDYFNKKIGLNLVNKYKDIKMTAFVMSKCDFFISLDSGLMHTANALDIPTIGLFGPTLTSKNRPWNNGGEVIQSKECNECYFTNLFRSCKDNKCMKEITADRVIEHIEGMVERSKEKVKKKVKICLVACRQLGESLKRTLSGMDNISKFYYYDYLNTSYNLSERANECDLVLVLHGVKLNLNLLNNVKTKTILWFNDNICRYTARLKEMGPYFDKIFTINKDNPPGMDFIPCGIDATQFTDLRLERDIEVSFIGNLYTDKRVIWLKEVRKYIDVSHFQDVDYDKYVKILNRSRITINEHYNIFGANMRFYEAIACKSLMITDEVMGIPEDFKEGEHYITYQDVPDLVNKVKYYLKNEKERRKITEAAYLIGMRNHKYSDRLNEIFRKYIK